MCPVVTQLLSMYVESSMTFHYHMLNRTTLSTHFLASTPTPSPTALVLVVAVDAEKVPLEPLTSRLRGCSRNSHLPEVLMLLESPLLPDTSLLAEVRSEGTFVREMLLWLRCPWTGTSL